VKDQHVRGERPHLLRQRGAQLLLDFHRVVAFGDADAVRDTEYVPIDGKAWNAKRMAQHHVRRLSAYAGQLRQKLHIRWHLTAMVGDEALRGADKGFSLLIEKSGRSDDRFEIGRRRLGERSRIGVLLEERGRDHVHACVGRLRREDRRHQQLKRGPIIQFRIGVRMLLSQCFDDSPRGLW
jgi:hypothetical protein